MSEPRAGPSRRVRAYAYTAVTTAIVLTFALAEWATERYMSERSRAASTAIEIAIVLIATLAFRPVHKWVDEAVEAAFNKRKRQSLAAIEKFRSELPSFNDTGQLLRRVVDAVDHYMEARASAVYLRREAFRAEISSFESPAQNVPLDDPLAVRLRSSGAPARQPLLSSAACGTHAFPMMLAGELVGFLCLESKQGEYDAEETQMLAGLAHDLAAALAALDPALRPRKRRAANNIPVNLPMLVGRDREMGEVAAALSNARLVTIAGSGGVGKTSLALQCAAKAIDEHADGAWFVDLAPITGGGLVAATMLAALEGGATERGDLASLIEHLRLRDALIVVDNCEHVLDGAVPAFAQILATCPQITILATSRELLHLEGEQVYRLGPLRSDAAVELFNRRAAAASREFDTHRDAGAVRDVCERLDGIPLAIELAAARVRALSVDEILQRLHERFKLLTSGTRAALPRQQTLEALIEWSYDLLNEDERALFRDAATFRGSFTLAAASAVCGDGEGCDEFHVLDVLTSLADKSLLTVTLALATRYRLLESIREFAAAKAAQSNETANTARRHALYFGTVAAQAYHEFDSRLPEGWLDGLAPDIDNFRAALEWNFNGSEPRAGAQLAADCGPMFLRLEQLTEGLRWCDAARSVKDIPTQTAGRVEYVASMMHNNLGENQAALNCALRAVEFYRRSSDERGLIRALSQTAQLYARVQRYLEASEPAAEAVKRARALAEPRVLVAVLRRCGYALPPDRIDTARAYFAEALEVAKSTHEPEEVCMVMEWWANREAEAGEIERAVELASAALQCADRGSLMSLEVKIAGWALALGRFDDAKPHALRALSLARHAQHPLARALAIAYSAPFHAESDPREAAQLFGYAMGQLRELGWTTQEDDRLAFDNALRAIRANLHEGDVAPLLADSEGWTEERALAALAR